MGMYSDLERSHINDVNVKTPDYIKQRNRELCEKYPFLVPHNRFSGKSILDCRGKDGEEGYWPGNPEDHPEYDYEYTELDDMPDGWRIAFGEQMCQDIMDALEDSNTVKSYGIDQIKEKFGFLCWYDHGGTKKIRDEIVPKYEDMSIRTCISCGQPAEYVSGGWISPWCTDCAKHVSFGKRFIPLEVWVSNKITDTSWIDLDEVKADGKAS